MNFEIYCDECRPELFSSKEKTHPYLSIGGIWIPAEVRSIIKDDIRNIREKHSVWGEFKWNKVSTNSIPCYSEIIDYFFENDNLRFRTILVDSRKVDLIKFHQNDGELGFYKFYYQLLHHWIYDFNKYAIFTDIKTNRRPDRLSVLCDVLNNTNLTSEIVGIQALPSDQVVLIQIADLLTGAVNGKANKSFKSPNKQKIIDRIEFHLGNTIAPTHKGEEKFNIFKIRFPGGW